MVPAANVPSQTEQQTPGWVPAWIGILLGIPLGGFASWAVLHNMSGPNGTNLLPVIGAFGFGIALVVFRRTRWIGVGVLIGTAPGMAFMEFLIAILVLWALSV